MATGSGSTSVSAAQVLKGFTIPKKDPASNIQSTLKDDDSSKEDDNEKAPAKFDDDRFKIPQGRSLMLKNVERSSTVYRQES